LVLRSASSGGQELLRRRWRLEAAAWRRRYFQLRHGTLQWYRDDPGVGGDFLGSIRLVPSTTIERDPPPDARLRVSTLGETLVVRDDRGETLEVWEAQIAREIARAREMQDADDGVDEGAEGGADEAASAAEGRPWLDLDREAGV